MGTRSYDAKRKVKNLRKNVFSPFKKAKNLQEEHAKQMVGKKTILVPHPTQPRCWIEKTVN